MHGLLSPAREKPLLDHARSCAACEELLREKVGDRERLRASLGARRRVGSGYGTARLHRRRSWFARPALGAIAAAAALVVFWIVRPGRVPEGPQGDHLHWLPEAGELLVTRAPGAREAEADLAEGLAAYARKDVTAAIHRLEAARASGSLESMRRAYLGSSLAWAGRHAEAAVLLRGLPAESLPEPWRSEIRWTLALSCRAIGHEASADSLLEILASQPGTVGERARARRATR